LLDVLWLVNSATRFTRHFGPLSGLDAKLENLEERYCATAFVMGSGMGVTQGARHMRGLVTAQTLSLINRRHITVDKLDAAYRDILDGYHLFELPRCWGSGKTASFDGSLFELSEQNLLADFHFRYRLKGAVAFQVVSDLYIALFMHFIPPGVWEAIYIIEALSKNKSKIQPDTVFADTQGQSTPVFAFTYLLGIKLMPRIRNWKDLNFFRPSKNVQYQHIDRLFKGEADWNFMETHWQDLMQVAISMYTGRISSPTLLPRREVRSRLPQPIRDASYKEVWRLHDSHRPHAWPDRTGTDADAQKSGPGRPADFAVSSGGLSNYGQNHPNIVWRRGCESVVTNAEPL
jgi:hypothetical protein